MMKKICVFPSRSGCLFRAMTPKVLPALQRRRGVRAVPHVAFGHKAEAQSAVEEGGARVRGVRVLRIKELCARQIGVLVHARRAARRRFFLRFTAAAAAAALLHM